MTILFYSRADEFTWQSASTQPHDEAYIAAKYRYVRPRTARALYSSTT